MSSSLQRIAPRPQAPCRLFCFPHAGGSAASFRRWPQLLPQVDVCAIQLPGRANRMAEACATAIPAMVDALLPDMLPLMDRPFALFGHSMGTALASELVLRLRQRGAAGPVQFFASARQPAHRPFPEESMRGLPDADFLARIAQRFGDFPAEIRDCPELLEMLTPMMRADFEALESYRPAAPAPLECPVTALGGSDDPVATAAHLHAWQACTPHTLHVRQFPGSHFYLDDNAAEVTALVARALVPAAQPPSARIVP